jgi:UDP-N-acetylglucosamine--N-acetylmuramyl-(pentapeptide) pyrophosphoryl-undecaprenol N-acetylglucosamine transferase
LNIVVAGGGTGGHLFPGIAIAEEFLERDAATKVLFIGTERGLERRVLAAVGHELRTIDIEGIKARGFRRALGAIAKIPRSMLQSGEILRVFRPDLVIGVGGYASGPVVAAAKWMGIPTAIAEQNALPGLTNRILGRVADRIFLTFTETRRWFADKKVIISGNPVRSGFKGCAGRKVKGAFTVLVFGGSQGARSINKAMAEAAPFLKEIRDGLKIIHQAGQTGTGPAANEWIEEAYRAAGIDGEVLPFIYDMGSAYAGADLLVCRAGATSIAEITACGKAAILIPFPYAANDHQTKNARVLADRGAAELVCEKELTGAHLAERIIGLYRAPGRIASMEANSAALGNLKAAAVIVDACLQLIKNKK